MPTYAASHEPARTAWSSAARGAVQRDRVDQGHRVLMGIESAQVDDVPIRGSEPDPIAGGRDLAGSRRRKAGAIAGGAIGIESEARPVVAATAAREASETAKIDSAERRASRCLAAQVNCRRREPSISAASSAGFRSWTPSTCGTPAGNQPTSDGCSKNPAPAERIAARRRRMSRGRAGAAGGEPRAGMRRRRGSTSCPIAEARGDCFRMLSLDHGAQPKGRRPGDEGRQDAAQESALAARVRPAGRVDRHNTLRGECSGLRVRIPGPIGCCSTGNLVIGLAATTRVSHR